MSNAELLTENNSTGLVLENNYRNEWYECLIGTCYVTLPPKLEEIDMRYHGYLYPYIPNIVLRSTNISLRQIYFQVTSTPTLRNKISCTDREKLPIELIDLNANSIYSLGRDTFFHCDFSSVKVFMFSLNNMDEIIKKCGNKTFLGAFPNLEDLSLAQSRISDIPEGIFENNTKLRTLNLARNYLRDFTLNISQLTHLEHINLAENKIECLQQDILGIVEKLILKNNFTLDLLHNPLACACECLSFYTWLYTNRGVLNDWSRYHCHFSNGDRLHFSQIDEIVQRLDAECISLIWLYAPTILLGHVFLIQTLIVIIYRFRYNIMYIWYKIRAEGKENRIGNTYFKYDAFIAYNQKDFAWVRQKLYRTLEEEQKDFTFCFHHKDFVPGATIVDNIIYAIDNSRYTILVVSNESLRSEWWQFEVNMAHQASIEGQRDMIICVFSGRNKC